MYASKVKGQKLTFQVSGMLWERSLVMRDLETKSLWSHHLGRAMDGKLKGAELDVLPAVLTTWKEWQARHQGSDVLAMKRTVNSFREQTLQNPKKFVYVIFLVVGYASTTGGIDLNRKLSSDRASRIASVVNSNKGEGQEIQAVFLGQTDRFSESEAPRNQICEIWEIRK